MKIRRVLCCYMSEIPFILSLQSTCKVSNELFAFKVIRHFAACDKDCTVDEVK